MTHPNVITPPPERRGPGTETPGAHGFVLVGVVMLVIALTILGLSLFSLSSYESQFINRSIDELQAFHDAQGGLERAKYVLAVPPYRLESVSQGLPLEHVTSALAKQLQGADTVSAGEVRFDGDDVVIRVTAEYRGVTRAVEGRYHPRKLENYYKRLVTSAGGIEVNASFGDPHDHHYDRSHTVRLTGGFWQNDPDTTSWIENVESYDPAGIRLDDVPIPDVASFIAAHRTWQTPLPDEDSGHGDRVYTLRAPGPDSVGYFRWEDHGDTFELEDDRKVTLRVEGHVVWMFERGVRFLDHVTIEREGHGEAALVLVAGPNQREAVHPDAGVWFWGGLTSKEDVPVVLVSDGGVQVEQIDHYDHDSKARSVSIFAHHVLFTGPEADGNHTMEIHHPADSDGVIDWLAAHGALPNTHGAATASFALAPGTWHESTP